MPYRIILIVSIFSFFFSVVEHMLRDIIICIQLRNLSSAVKAKRQSLITANIDSVKRRGCVIGPIPWGHSGPLCHALSLSSLWTSHAACAIAIAACD